MQNEPEWINWGGLTNECPTPNGHDVEVRFLDRQTSRHIRPEEWTWYSAPDHVADCDIVAYRDWTAFYEQQDMINQCWTTAIKNQEEKKMTGQQFKQQSAYPAHPASALAEQIDSARNQANEEHATVADLLKILNRDQQLFALGYLTAKLNK